MTVTRADVRERLLGRKHVEVQVAKASMAGRLAPAWSKSNRMILHTELNKWLITCSKVTHRLSLIVNRYLEFLLRENRPLPSFSDAFFTGAALSGLKKNKKGSKEGFNQDLDDYVANEFWDFPVIERQRGDCQAIVIAAQRYRTNFLNALKVPFFQRQKAFVYLWCELQGVPEDSWKDVLFAINGWLKKKTLASLDLPAAVLSFIREQRLMLGEPSNVSNTSLPTTEQLLRYYYHIIGF
jgi:hypothetical protein